MTTNPNDPRLGPNDSRRNPLVVGPQVAVAPATPTTADRWKIELKVIASTAMTFVVSVLVAVLNEISDQHELLGSIPGALQFLILAVIPTALTFLSGYMARHTPRSGD